MFKIAHPQLAFTLLCAALISSSALALDDSLPRRGVLGAQLQPVERELRSANGLNAREGIQILDVMPDSAALQAGLQSEDIVLAIDDTKVEGTDALSNAVNQIGAHKDGEEIALRVLRAGEERIITARLNRMPEESYPDFATEYGHLTVDGARHRTIVTKPNGDGPFPAVLFLQGLGCGSVDQWYAPDNHTRQLMAGFTKAGFVTVRVEKRGVGDSEGGPCDEMDFQTELRGHQAALAYTQSLEYTDNVFVFGHSMGGVFAPLVAAKQDVAGVIAFGTIGKPLPHYFVENNQRQAKLRGRSEANLQEQLQALETFVQLFFGERLTPGEIEARDASFKSFFAVRNSDATHFHGVHYTFWHQLDDIDKAKAWASVSAPVLVLYGEADYAASQDDHPYIRDAVNAAHPGNATYVELDNIGHAFETAGSQKETMENRFAGEFNPTVVDTTVQWMRERL